MHPHTTTPKSNSTSRQTGTKGKLSTYAPGIIGLGGPDPPSWIKSLRRPFWRRAKIQFFLSRFLPFLPCCLATALNHTPSVTSYPPTFSPVLLPLLLPPPAVLFTCPTRLPPPADQLPVAYQHAPPRIRLRHFRPLLRLLSILAAQYLCLVFDPPPTTTHFRVAQFRHPLTNLCSLFPRLFSLLRTAPGS